MYLKTLTPERQVSESGLRFLNTELGRWLSRDPIGEAGGVNLHTLLGNSPITRIDAIGQKEAPAAAAGKPQKDCCRCVRVHVGIVKNPPVGKLINKIINILGPTQLQFHFGVAHPYVIKTTGGKGCKCEYIDVGKVTVNGNVHPLNKTTPIACKSDIDGPGIQPDITFVPGVATMNFVLGIDLLHGIKCTSADGSSLAAIGQTTLSPVKFKILVTALGVSLGTPEYL